MTTTPASPTPEAPSQATPQVATTSKRPAKPKSRRAKIVKRRGARLEEDEGESAGEGDGSKTAAVSDSDSDFSPGSEDDEDEDEDEEDEADGEGELKGASATTAVSKTAPDPLSAASTAAKAVADSESGASPSSSTDAQFANVTHPSWSDAAANDSLPVLDFASLSLDNVPTSSTTAPNSTAFGPSTVRNKKQQLEAKREYQKAQDPEGFAASEQARAEKRKLKQAKLKEKRAAAKAEKRAAAQSSAVGPAPANEAKSTAADQPPVISKSAGGSSRKLARDADEGDKAASLPAPPPAVAAARGAYEARLAADPSYIPRVGKFWSHDDRLAAPEHRALNPFWRGRGRGRGRGGLGASRGGGRGGWTGSNGRDAHAIKASDGDGSDDDGWGRGEAKRVQRSAVAPDLPAWSHDGFDELQSCPPRARDRRQNGAVTGPPGSINPQYAHLPFHPKHRFPALPPSSQIEAVQDPDASLSSSQLSETKTRVAPGTANGGPAPTQEDVPDVDADGSPRGVVVNLGPRTKGAVTVFPPPRSTTSSTATEDQLVTAEQRHRGAASILYAADPGRVLRHQQEQMMYQHPPPHLVGQPTFVPYPPQYYSPDAFPSIPTPGATPPPLFSAPQHGVQQPLFTPARTSKIEIKAPGPEAAKQSSATGGTFRPARAEQAPPPLPSHMHPAHTLYPGQMPMPASPGYPTQPYGYDAQGTMYFGAPPAEYMMYPPPPLPPQGYMGPQHPDDPAIASMSTYWAPQRPGMVYYN